MDKAPEGLIPIPYHKGLDDSAKTCSPGQVYDPTSPQGCRVCDHEDPIVIDLDKISEDGEVDDELFYDQIQEMKHERFYTTSFPVNQHNDDLPISRLNVCQILLLALGLLYYLIIRIMMCFCDKEKFVTIFHNLDNHYLTGRRKSSSLGGIIIVYTAIGFVICIVVMSLYYMYRNRFVRRKYQHYEFTTYDGFLPANIELDYEAIIGTITPETGVDGFETVDLCEGNRYSFVTSDYLETADFVDHSCRREKIGPTTDRYVLKVVYRGVDRVTDYIDNEFVKVMFDAANDQVLLFFQWRFNSVWSYEGDDKAPTINDRPWHYAYSEASPNPDQMMCLQGIVPTQVKMFMYPYYHVDFFVSEQYEGYKAVYESTTLGSSYNIENPGDYPDGTKNLIRTKFNINQADYVYMITDNQQFGVFQSIAIILGLMALVLLIGGRIKANNNKGFKRKHGYIDKHGEYTTVKDPALSTGRSSYGKVDQADSHSNTLITE